MYFYPRAHCTFEHLYGCKLLLTPTNNRLSRQGIGEPYLNPMLFQQLHAGFVHSIADQHFSYIEGHIWVGNEYTEKSGQPVDCVNFCQLLSATHDLRRRANKLNWLRERVSRAIEPDFECLSPVQCDCCFFLGDNQTTERIGERHLDLKVLSFFSRDLFFLSVRVWVVFDFCTQNNNFNPRTTLWLKMI